MKLQAAQIPENFLKAEILLAFQEGLSYIGLVSSVINC
jgi:hypothetical protein